MLYFTLRCSTTSRKYKFFINIITDAVKFNSVPKKKFMNFFEKNKRKIPFSDRNLNAINSKDCGGNDSISTI